MFTLKSYIPNPIWLSCIRVPAFLTLLRLRPSPGCDTEPNRVQTTKFSPLIFTVSPPYVSAQNFINTPLNTCEYVDAYSPTKLIKNLSKDVKVYNLNFFSNRIMSTTGLQASPVVITRLIIPLSPTVFLESS